MSSRRLSSLQNASVGIAETIDSKYDSVKIVADNIDAIVVVDGLEASGKLDDVISAADSALAVTNMTAATGLPGTSAVWDEANGILTVPRGDEGLSAYGVAVDEGFVGTEAAWLADAEIQSRVGNTTDNTVGNTTGNTTGNTLNNTLNNTIGNTSNNTDGNTSGNDLNNTVNNTFGNTAGNTTGNNVNNTTGNTLNNTAGNTVGNNPDHQWVGTSLQFTEADGVTFGAQVDLKGDIGKSVDSVVSDKVGNITTVTVTGTFDNSPQAFSISDGAAGAGSGDMGKATYDTNDNGVVDNAELINNLTVETAVPVNALFTDSVYSHPNTDGNLHVPATSTTNSGKVLTAGATPGVFTWETNSSGVTNHTLLSSVGTNTHVQIDNHIAEGSTHFTQAAISITESQISDLGTYLTSETVHPSDVLVAQNITDIENLSGTNSGDQVSSDFTHNALTGYDVSEHRVINDAGVAVTDLFSASKITADLALKSDTHSHPYLADTVTHNTLSGFVSAEHVDWAAGSQGVIHVTNLPAPALTSVFTVADQVGLLALTAQEGDVAIQTDIVTTFINNGGIAGTMTDWSELAAPPDAAVSLNTAARHNHSNTAALDLVSGTNTGDQVIPVSTVDFDPVGTDNSDNNAVNTLYSGLTSHVGLYLPLATTTDDMSDTATNRYVTDAQISQWDSGDTPIAAPKTVGEALNYDNKINQLQDSLDHLVPAANSVTANHIITVELTELYSAQTPTLSLTGGDLFRTSLGTDTSIVFSGAATIRIMSNGTDEWEVYVLAANGAESLNNVDNTSDLNKPISTATQTALDDIEALALAGL